MEDFGLEYQKTLLTPLQPLRDNLNSEIYNVFEHDTVKYVAYAAAFRSALKLAFDKKCSQQKKDTHIIIENNNRDCKNELENNSNQIVVIVLGPGRGPLVAKVVEESNLLDIPIDLYVVEKNKYVIPTLERRNETEWNSIAKIFCADCRTWPASFKADIIVSEMLGSFSDNELAPEILEAAERLLKSI
ncbi:MAG: Protein arginine N-methyltransferase 5 [Paramarteilia canceri]